MGKRANGEIHILETQLCEEVIRGYCDWKGGRWSPERGKGCMGEKTQTKAVSEKEAIKLPYQEKYLKSIHLSVFSTHSLNQASIISLLKPPQQHADWSA